MKKKSISKNKKEYYVNPKEFYEMIKKFYETKNLDDNLAQSVYKIAVGLSYAPNFINYSYKDDMIGDAVVKMFAALKNEKFDVTQHSNPFSYFTTIAYHAFINRIKKEKRHKETINEYQEILYEEMMCKEGNGKVYVRCKDEEYNGDDE